MTLRMVFISPSIITVSHWMSMKRSVESEKTVVGVGASNSHDLRQWRMRDVWRWYRWSYLKLPRAIQIMMVMKSLLSRVVASSFFTRV